MLTPGTLLGHYRIVEEIGKGGMGVVYRAHDQGLDRDVAVKVLPTGTLADEAARKRFHKEALALSKLNHPNIETVHDFDTQDGVDFLVMEHIPGISLSERVAGGPLPEKEIAQLGLQMAEGLAAAHKENIVHRDIKPGNLRVTPEGRLKILDFGIAKLARPVSETAQTESFTETQAVAGTLPYMAPEELRGEKVDTRSDIYAAGVVLYEMATGRRPFADRKPAQLLAAILQLPLSSPRALNRRVSLELERIVLKCLEKDPENRYQSAKELMVDLRRLGQPTAVLALARRPVITRRWLFIGLGAMGVLLSVFLALNVGGLRERLFGAGTPQIDSLAVLPLKNLMGDPEQEYFVEGMQEALTTELSKISALKVISRTSTMRYKDTDKPLPQIARELDVEGVIEGSVLREGDQVRITVQLIHGASDQHLWAESYQRELRGVLALQSEVARAIATEIKVQVTPEEQVRLAGARPVNPEAYDLYVKGRYYWERRNEEALQRSLVYFQQAIEKDPDFALAYAGLANSYNVLPVHGSLPGREAYPKARVATMQALKINDGLAEAHTSLAWIKWRQDWDWAGAESEYRRAMELAPNSALTHHWYALYLAAMGRREEALGEIKRAQELDPLSLIINANVGLVYFYSRDYDQALRELRRTLEMDANFAQAHIYVGHARVQKDMYEEAIAAYHRAITVAGARPPTYLGFLAHAYARAGHKAEAEKLLKELLARQPTPSAC